MPSWKAGGSSHSKCSFSVGVRGQTATQQHDGGDGQGGKTGRDHRQRTNTEANGQFCAAVGETGRGGAEREGAAEVGQLLGWIAG